MSTHVIHRVEGDLAPFVAVELVDTDITGWTIKLLGIYRDTFQQIEINHTADVAADGQFHFEWGAGDLIRGVADFEIDFLPLTGDRFTVPAENTLLLKVRGKTEPGPGVISGGQTIQILEDGRTINVVGGGGGGGSADSYLISGITNNDAGSIDDGDVVVFSGAKGVATTTTANDKAPRAARSSAATTELVDIATAGPVPVRVVAGTYAIGDTLVTSATAKQAQVNNAQTDPSRILGYAWEAKVAAGGETVITDIGS